MVTLGSVGKLRRRPESEQFFRLAKPVPSDAEGTEAGDVCSIVDTAGCSQADNSGCLDPTVAAKQLNNKTVQENKPLEARSSAPSPEHSKSVCVGILSV